MPRGRPATVNVKDNEAYFREYYHKTNEPYQCECGCKITLHTKNRHQKTKKHLDLIEFRKAQDELRALKEKHETNPKNKCLCKDDEEEEEKKCCDLPNCIGGRKFQIRDKIFCSPVCGNTYFQLTFGDEEYWEEEEDLPTCCGKYCEETKVII